MKVLLTGSSGFIGSHLAIGLMRENHNLFTLNRDASVGANGAHVIPIIGDRVTTMLKAFDLYKFDYVIHAATSFQTRPSISKLSQVIDSNVTFGAELAKISIERGVPFINFSSSWQWIEHGPKRQNIYRQSKTMFEDILSDSMGQVGVKATSVVLSETYYPNDQRNKLIPMLMRNLRAGQVTTLSHPKNVVNLDSPVDVVLLIVSLLRQNEWPRFVRPTPHVDTTLDYLVHEVERLEQKQCRVDWDGTFTQDLYRKEYFEIDAFFNDKPSIHKILIGVGSQ